MWSGHISRYSVLSHEIVSCSVGGFTDIYVMLSVGFLSVLITFKKSTRFGLVGFDLFSKKLAGFSLVDFANMFKKTSL